eukprot:530372-Ditylum_brightwellii.AAC.2
MDTDGNPLVDDKGKTIMERIEVCTKEALEFACMIEVGNRSRMSESTPPMTEPLVSLLQYHGMTEFTDNILQGTAHLVDGIETATQLLLDECTALLNDIPPVAELLSYETYLQEIATLRERTSSGPSLVYPAMIKTEAKDFILSRVAWLSSNIPWIS